MEADREIMVVEREILFPKGGFQGFSPAEDCDYGMIISANYCWLEKKYAEIDPRFKQPIAYSIIYNSTLGKIFLYQRSKIDKEYSEGRLQGKLSCGVGGHIERVDTIYENPIYISTLRELREEVSFTGHPIMEVLGYINDETNDVSKVHFGIVYLVTIDSDKVQPLDPEISVGGLVPIDLLIRLLDVLCESGAPVEPWTKIVLEPLKNL